MENIILGIIVLFFLAEIGILYFVLKRSAIKSYHSPAPFQRLEQALVSTIEETGWKLLSTHDIQSKLVGAGYDFKRIAVFEVCKPAYAAEVLKQDKNKKFSSLMPCRISLYEHEDGTTGISMMNAGMLSRVFGGVVARVMGKASRESEQIIQKTIEKAIL